MATIHAYVNFSGNCEEAFNFYKSVFGGEFQTLSRFSDMPSEEGIELPKEHLDKIMHVTLKVDNDLVLMGSDTGGDWAPKLVVGNNITLSYNADSLEGARTCFDKLSSGGKVTMPFDKPFWGGYFGMCTDQYDVNWMVNFDPASAEK